MILIYYFLKNRPAAPSPKPGKKRGPAPGMTEDPVEFLARHTDIQELLWQGKSLRCVQKATGKARNTVIKVRRMTHPDLP